MIRKLLVALFVILLSACEKTTDSSGTILKFYGDAFVDVGYSVAKADDGYVIAGQLTKIKRDANNYIQSSAKKIGIIRTSAVGNTIWKKTLGDSITFGDTITGSASKVITLTDGSIVCTGYVNRRASLQDIFIIKLDFSGAVLSKKIFIRRGNQYATDILKTETGFLILGTTDVVREPSTEYSGNAEGKKDLVLLRTDDNLTLIDSLQTGFIGNDDPVSVKNDINNGYVVFGTTDRSDKPSAEQAGNNVILYKVNSNLSVRDFKIFGGVKSESAADFEVLNDGYFLAGTIGNEGSDQKGYVWKLSEDIHSEPVCQHEIDIEPNQITKSSFSLKAICKYKTNSYLLAGQYGTGSTARMLIFAADADGNIIEGKLKVEGGTGTQNSYDVLSDSDNIVALGTDSYENNSMISLLKFRF